MFFVYIGEKGRKGGVCMKSIRMKLSVYFGIIILLSSIAIGFLGFFNNTRGMNNNKKILRTILTT